MTIQELYHNIDGDYEYMKRTLKMDQLIERLILKFLNDRSYPLLHQAWTTKDEKGIFEISHSLKGVSSNLGLEKISGYASEVCEEYRPGNEKKMSEDELQRTMDSLDALYARTIDEINRYQQQE